MVSHDSLIVYVAKSDGNRMSFMRFVQLFFDETAIMLNITAIEAYPAHLILLKLFAR